jgi:hypothetical protein
MLEYAVKKVITNPTLITNSTEIIKIIDNRSHQTRAFVLPVSYTPLIEKLEKELEFKKWVARKKALLTSNDISKKDDMSDMMGLGIESIEKCF